MDEMEELAQMHIRFQEKGCGIVGLEWEQDTDADGTAFFEVPAGIEYEIHVLKVPEIYEKDNEVYTITADSFEMNIHLQKASETENE